MIERDCPGFVRWWLIPPDPTEIDFSKIEIFEAGNGKQAKAAACRCPCCERCWLFIEGEQKGRCIHQGPYTGYVEVPD